MKRFLMTLFLISQIMGCKGENKVEKGFSLLQHGRYGEAKDIFYELYLEGDKTGSFGLMLTDFLKVIEIADYVYTVIGGHPSDQPFSPFEKDENIFLYQTVVDYLTSISDMLDEGLNAGNSIEDYSAEIPYIPVYIGRAPTFNLGGHWNMNDLRFFRGIIELISSLFHLLLSQNLYADYYSIFEYAKPIVFEGGIDPGDPLKPVSAKRIVNILIFMFSSSPDFLTLKDSLEWEQFRTSVIGGLRDILASLKSEGEKVTVVREDGFAKKLVIKDFVLENGEVKDTERDIDDDAINSISLFLDNLRGDIPYITWEEFSVFISFAVSAIFGELSFGDTTISNPYLILKSLLPALFSGQVALNPGKFISSPFGFREFLPLYRFDDTPEDNFFLLEWECLDEIPIQTEVGTLSHFPSGNTSIPYIGWLLCSGNSDFYDTVHFTDDVYRYWNVSQISQDGISSAIPYLAFLTPSFNGLLLLNPSVLEYDVSYPQEYTYPDNRLLNFFIQKEIGSLLSSFL